MRRSRIHLKYLSLNLPIRYDPIPDGTFFSYSPRSIWNRGVTGKFLPEVLKFVPIGFGGCSTSLALFLLSFFSIVFQGFHECQAKASSNEYNEWVPGTPEFSANSNSAVRHDQCLLHP